MTFISIHLSPALHPKPNPTPNPYNPEPAAMVIGTQASGALVLHATAHQPDPKTWRREAERDREACVGCGERRDSLP